MQALQQTEAERQLQHGGGALVGVLLPARAARALPGRRVGDLSLCVHLPRHHAGGDVQVLFALYSVVN